MSDTIVAAIISGVLGLLGGFISGYGVCKFKINKKMQIQKAGENSLQIQVGELNGKK